MQPALRVLLSLKCRGGVRRVLRSLTTWRGRLLFLFGLAVFVM